MVDFIHNRNFKTRESILKVDAGLPVGVYTFCLVVENDSGKKSEAAQVKVKIVTDGIPPTSSEGEVTIPDIPVIAPETSNT